MGSLSILQGIFQTQESNQGLLHYRRILYQLSHQESITEENKAGNGEVEKLNMMLRKT